MTHTYALLELSQAAYDEIRAKLEEAGYQHTFHEENRIDMHGIAVIPPCPICIKQSLQCTCCERELPPDDFIPDFQTCQDCKDCLSNFCLIEFLALAENNS